MNFMLALLWQFAVSVDSPAHHGESQHGAVFTAGQDITQCLKTNGKVNTTWTIL
jgi:hypothetical protein